MPSEWIDDFDGAKALIGSWGSGLTPDPWLTVSEWSDGHRWLSSRASAEPGRYRPTRTPYMREIMDRLSPGDPAQRVVFMKAAQVGATKAGNNWIGFVIHQAPGPMLAVQPTVELAKRNSRQRIDPLIEESPEFRGLSRIEREFEVSDQRRYVVPCPHCGHEQWLKFERLRWQKGRPGTAEYHCEGCERSIPEHHKTAMLEAGEWRATATSADPASVGYHLSALYSPVGWLSWARIARAHEAARGNDEAMRAFRNTILGETWG